MLKDIIFEMTLEELVNKINLIVNAYLIDCNNNQGGSRSYNRAYTKLDTIRLLYNDDRVLDYLNIALKQIDYFKYNYQTITE